MVPWINGTREGEEFYCFALLLLPFRFLAMALPGAEDMEGTYSNGSKSFLDRGNPERPILIPDNFDGGKGDFDNWVSYFECVATINGWTNEEKLLWIRVSLRGAAHVAYQHNITILRIW